MKRKSTTVMRRIGQVIAVLGMVAGLSVATAGPAMAAVGLSEPACNYDNVTYNVCLKIDYLHSGLYVVEVGIDLYMTPQAAQLLIDQPSTGFSAALWGDDGGPGQDDFLSDIPGAWVAVWSGGLSAQFKVFLYWYELNEDDGRDEIIARVRFYAPVFGRDNSYKSGQVVANF